MRKLILLFVIALLAFSFSVVISCTTCNPGAGGGGDDDYDGYDGYDGYDDDTYYDDDDTYYDDDNTSADDDSGGSSDAYNDCVSYYADCAGLGQSEAESYCYYIDEYGAYWNDCYDTVFSDLWACLWNAGCSADIDYEAATICSEDMLDAIMNCY